jgi:hypothetical protein
VREARLASFVRNHAAALDTLDGGPGTDVRQKRTVAPANATILRIIRRAAAIRCLVDWEGVFESSAIAIGTGEVNA